MLRVGLAFVFLWFGFSQIADAAMWVGYVPVFVTKFMQAGTVVYMNGLFEVVAGSMLALGILTRYVALLLGIHLFVIGTSMGLTATAVRDIGLSLAAMALFYLGNDRLTLTGKKNI